MANLLLNLFRKLRRKLNVIRGKEVDFNVTIDVSIQKFGSEYGGYWIKKGSLNQESIVYSVGIGEDMSFDFDLINEIRCHVFAFDPTPKSIDWIKKQNQPENFIFTPWGISDFDDEAEFHPPNNPEHFSHSLIQHKGVQSEGVKVPFRRLATIMNLFEHKAIDLLKMDIEGEEYAVIKDIVSSNIQVNQICLEFHHRFSGLGIEHTKEAVEDLKAIGLYLFHQDGNCCSFIRK